MKKLLLSILTVTAFGAGANAQTFTDSLLSTNSTNARSIVSADIDGDGDLDLLSSSQGNNEIAWFENTDGQGTFSKNIVGLTNNPYRTLAGDLDGDGDLDVVAISNGSDQVIWWKNTDGAGTFSATATMVTNLADGVADLYLIDLDGDGDLDILSASYLDDKIAYYLNDGTGVFGSQNTITTGLNGAITVYAADMDGDGDMDIIAGGSLANRVLYFQNGGSLNFTLPVTISTTASEVTSVTAADIDGDSDLDILATFGATDKVVWFENTNALASFGTEQIISSVADRPFKASVADLDNDGDLDVLSANFNDNEIVWYENTNGTGTFGTAQVISSVTQGASYVSAGDIDGDGDMDVISASFSDHSFNWYRNSLISVGISEYNKETVTIYPNPATSQLTLNTTEQSLSISILDITGKTVKTIVSNNNTIDVSDLTKGIYFLQIQTDNGSMAVSKFIKE